MKNQVQENCLPLTLTSVTFDGDVFTPAAPIPAENIAGIKAFINESIQSMLKVGDCNVHYQNFAGLVDMHISIMNSNIQSAQIQFNGSADCIFAFEQRECCTIKGIDPGADIDWENMPANEDLFHESITYTGLDISMIEMIGSCTSGLIRNHYGYDADHRVTKVQNELYQPHFIDGALSTNYSYDPAGNIKTLNRSGWVPDDPADRTVGEYKMIDKLTYSYSGSKLNSVIDKITDQLAQKEGFGKSNPTSNYTYDPNGNLTGDSGKGFSGANYNLLNLPEDIFGIKHEYTFSGEKIKKEGEDGIRTYIGGLEFLDGTLEQINIPNGRILKKDGDKYQYNLTDHLGNVVVVFEDKGNGIFAEEHPDYDGEVIQRSHYYSFGMRVDMPRFDFGDEPENKYLYNGKELNSDFGLDWLDLGFRYYDPAIGRFPSVDPIADQFAHVSPFNYAENEPIGHIDLWGLQQYPASKYRDLLNDPEFVKNHPESAQSLRQDINKEKELGQEYGVPLVVGLMTGGGLLAGGGRLLAGGFTLQNSAKAGLTAFTADFAGQYSMAFFSGEEFEYNFVSGLSNTIFKNPFTANYIASQFSLNSDFEFKFNSVGSSIVAGSVGGLLGQYSAKFSKFLGDEFTLSWTPTPKGDPIHFTNPIATGTDVLTLSIFNAITSTSDKTAQQIDSNNDEDEK